MIGLLAYRLASRAAVPRWRSALVAVSVSGLAACGAAASSGPSPAIDQPPVAHPEAPVDAASSNPGVRTTFPSAMTSTVPTSPSIVATTAPASLVGQPPATSPTGDGRLTLAFAGDALWHSPLWRQAERNHAANRTGEDVPGGPGMDFTPMLAKLTPVLQRADLAVCHLETPIAPVGERYSTHPLYGVPAEVVTSIASAGFDRCSTASNHTADRGPAGIDRTIGVLESNGLGQSGMARTPAEIEPQVFVIDGVPVSHLSYTYGYNGLVLPAGEEWRSALIEPTRIIADAGRARQLGAQVVIVSMHWGVEGQSGVSDAQRAVAEQITVSGAIDLVVGHHAHVLQPIEQVNGVWVVYGLGNLISNLPTSSRWPAASQDGAVAVVDVTIDADGTAVVSTPAIHPTWVDRDNGWVVHLVQPALEDPAIGDGVRGRLESSLQRTQTVVGAFVAR